MPDATTAADRAQGLTILITEGSSITARQAIYDLGPYHTLDICDPSPLCQCRFSRYVRRWHRSPKFSEDPCGFLSFLGQRLSAERYDVVLPLHDEVFLLSRVRDALSKRVGIAVPEFANLEIFQSKVRFHSLLEELDLPQPHADVLSEKRELDAWSKFPRYLKADYGTAGQAVRLVHDRRELADALAAFEGHGWWSAGSPLLLQEPATGRQSFVRAVFQHGRLVAHHATSQLLVGVGGAAVAKEGVHHPIVVDHLQHFGARLRWHGVLFCDYFYDEATQLPSYIEANPRLGDSANATFSGVNLCQQWAEVSLGREVAPLPSAKPGVRSHSTLLITLSKALEGAGRGELWHELRRQRRGDAIYENSHDELTRPAVDRLSALPFAWIAGRLLVNPGAAHRVVRSTVANYALNAAAAKRIREVPYEQLVACLEK